MAEPLQASFENQVQIARLSQLLQRGDLSDELRSKMFAERGQSFDRVGLRDLARLDYNQSLLLNPVQSDLYNLLGVYYTQIAEFDAAYDAFNSALELDPDNSDAERNRAIALYYGDRFQLALEGIHAHYLREASDPFRQLWHYLIEYKSNPEKARSDLEHAYLKKDSRWEWTLVAITLGSISRDDGLRRIQEGVKDNTHLAQRLTETYFYLGKRYQMHGNLTSAEACFKLALSFNVYDYIEHRYAYLELIKIYQQSMAQ
jgi:lipoprotein NlpI